MTCARAASLWHRFPPLTLLEVTETKEVDNDGAATLVYMIRPRISLGSEQAATAYEAIQEAAAARWRVAARVPTVLLAVPTVDTADATPPLAGEASELPLSLIHI